MRHHPDSMLIYMFFCGLPLEGLRSMPGNKKTAINHPVLTLPGARLTWFEHQKKILSPYQLWLTFRDWVQLERITFRAVHILLRTALFVCSESDTFLMNYIISIQFSVTILLYHLSRWCITIVNALARCPRHVVPDGAGRISLTAKDIDTGVQAQNAISSHAP